jgi:glycerol-3-phosphate O-acyltransferase
VSDPVTIPWWVLAILSVFAAIALVDRIFAPATRWFFRRRVNEAIDELNTRLDLRIQPFKLTRRQSLVDQLMYDPLVIEAVDREAKQTNVPRNVVMAKAQKYAKEIVPHFSARAYFGFGTKIARWISRFVYRVRLGYSDDEAIRSIDPKATVVFIMNHRSNMDYVLLTFMASSRASLSYAVGEWARIFLLQSIIRAMGAYFIRRDSGNELYRRVLARYVNMATRQGVTQAVLPEGGLTRDGKLRDPRLGLISYMISDFDKDNDRDVVFVPVGLNYDRVIEDRILTAKQEKDSTGRNFRVSLSSIAGVIRQLFWLRIKGQLYRAGYAVASFGTPISTRDYLNYRKLNFRKMSEKDRFKEIEKLGTKLIDAIGAVIPAVPVALVSYTMLKLDKVAIGELELKSKVFELISRLESIGTYSHIPREDRDYAVSTGLRMLTLRHIIEKTDDGLYRVNPKETVLLQYYANSISHLL